MAQPSHEPNPGQIFDTLNAHQRTAALRGAIDLDLFSAIAQGKRTAAALAQHCRTDERATRILCDYLTVIGFLTKQGNEYGLSPTSAVFLDRRSPAYMGGIARFINSPNLVESVRDVAELVRRGRTLLGGAGTVETNYQGWVEFARCMVPLIMPSAEFIAKLAAERLPGPIKVLDIAAGHGMFGICVARRNPKAHIVALDWEAVLAVARENAERAGVADRHTLLPGDALKMDYGSGFDLVLVTNFFHHFDVPTCEMVMQKIRRCLKPQGLVITLEFVPNEDRVSPAEAATFSFMMLATTASGDAYTLADYSGMFQKAGFTKNEMLDVPQSAQRVILSSAK